MKLLEIPVQTIEAELSALRAITGEKRVYALAGMVALNALLKGTNPLSKELSQPAFCKRND